MRIAAAVYEVLRPILNEIKEDISCIKSDMASLNETVSQLAGKLEDHKNETTYEFASVNSELVDLQLSLQSMIDNPPIEAVSSAVLVSLVPYFNAMESGLKTELATGLNSLNSSLRDDLNNLKTELATGDDLKSMEHDIKTEFVTGLNTMRGSMGEDLNDIKTELSGVSNTTQGLCDKIEEHDAEITAELKELSEYLIPQRGYRCGGTGGWRRAIYLDMTDPNTECPSGWNLTDYSKRTCGRASTGQRTCDSVFFPVSGGPYSQVCGRIRAYQWGWSLGFYGFRYGRNTIDSDYFDGVAVMHGSPLQHIWTFAIGVWENDTTLRYYYCPCDTTSDLLIPPFVGEDYFCESGYVYPGYRNTTLEHRFHSNDTLWDGEDCHSSSSCCSLHNPPYFTKSLGQSTTDDLELRMCHYHPIRYSNKAVELVELYVK